MQIHFVFLTQLKHFYIWRSHEGVAFAEFDRNFNFIPNDILTDFVVRSKNHGNYSPYQMNFVRDEIIDSLMKQ